MHIFPREFGHYWRPKPYREGDPCTSGHRGSSFTRSFNEAHVLAISQAICHYRRQAGTDGPLFIGCDTHALSQPAFESALEVLSANGVEVMVSAGGEYTPTPAVSQGRTIRRKMAAASTIRRMVARPTAPSRPGSRPRPIAFLSKG